MVGWLLHKLIFRLELFVVGSRLGLGFPRDNHLKKKNLTTHTQTKLQLGLSLLFVFIASGGGSWSRVHLNIVVQGSTVASADIDFGLQHYSVDGTSGTYSDALNAYPKDNSIFQEIQRGGVGTSAVRQHLSVLRAGLIWIWFLRCDFDRRMERGMGDRWSIDDFEFLLVYFNLQSLIL